MDAVIYARISKDRQGRALGVRRQEKACREKATAIGWDVAAVYIDNDVSATSTKPRPEYLRLLSDIETGAVKAVVVYDLDRLTRRPAELEHFISLADQYGIALANVSGDVDLTNANGRMIARIKGAVARQETERLSERNQAQKRQRAESGLPMAARYRLFGYTRAWELVPDEAEVVREVFRRVLSGEAKNTISRDLAERGIKTTSGAEWNRGQTNRLIANHIYAGIYVLKGEVIGKTSVPALVDEATFEAVNAAMARFAAGHNSRKYLLSGFLVCHVCKTGMVGNTRRGNDRRYRCNHLEPGACGRLSIKADWIDTVLNNYMTAMQGYDVLDVPSEPVEDFTEDILTIDKAIDGLHAAHNAGELDLQDLMRLLRDKRRDRSELVSKQSQVIEADTFFDGAYDWQELDLAGKRARIAQYFQHIFVLPKRDPGSRTFDENRVYALMTNGDVVPGHAFNVMNPLTRTFMGPKGPIGDAAETEAVVPPRRENRRPTVAVTKRPTKPVG